MLKNDGFVYCWGDNRFFQLGIFNEATEYSTIPTKVEWLSNIVEISSSSYGSCARNTIGMIVCCGLSTYNVYLNYIFKNGPEYFSSTNIIDIFGLPYASFFLTKDGEVLALQSDNYLGFIYPSLTLWSTFANVVKIYSGPTILCAINTTGSV